MLTAKTNLQITHLCGAEGAQFAIEEREKFLVVINKFVTWLCQGGCLLLHSLVVQNHKVHRIANCLRCVPHSRGL